MEEILERVDHEEEEDITEEVQSGNLNFESNIESTSKDG